MTQARTQDFGEARGFAVCTPPATPGTAPGVAGGSPDTRHAPADPPGASTGPLDFARLGD